MWQVVCVSLARCGAYMLRWSESVQLYSLGWHIKKKNRFQALLDLHLWFIKHRKTKLLLILLGAFFVCSILLKSCSSTAFYKTWDGSCVPREMFLPWLMFEHFNLTQRTISLFQTIKIICSCHVEVVAVATLSLHFSAATLHCPSAIKPKPWCMRLPGTSHNSNNCRLVQHGKSVFDICKVWH